jgi:signal transduction histidine kinase
MAITQNLLTKTLRWYVAFAAGILLITAPIFYFTTQRLYIDEANETLKLHKKEFIHYHLSSLTIDGIENWNKYNRDEKIIPGSPKHKKDKFRTEIFFDTLSREHEPYRVLRSSITIEGKPFTFVAKINLVEREDLIKSIVLLFLGLLTIMLVGLYFITIAMSSKLWRPFYIALNNLENFEVNKASSTALSPTNISEFTRLNQAIEELIQKNTQIYNNQKEFIENAAHELQTPLAIIQGKLEVLFQQSSLTQSQSEALEKLSESVSRLSRLNKNLLLLSRIDYDKFQESESISMNDLIQKHMEFFNEQASSKNITLNVEANQQIVVSANITLTEVLVNNLLLNAIKHNVIGGTVSVVLTSRKLLISNTGSDVALPAEKIFDRFAKINPATQGSGLGLAIVKKIADQNRWKIHYHFENHFHIFTVDF